MVRPRELGDNASPSGHSAVIHACLTYAALTGSTSHREVAERAMGLTRKIAETSPRFAGHTLAAAATAVSGPVEIAIVGKPGARRDELEETARTQSPIGSVVVVAAPATSSIPLLEGRREIQDRPAAYVCRQMVCRQPVTEPADLRGLLRGA